MNTSLPQWIRQTLCAACLTAATVFPAYADFIDDSSGEGKVDPRLYEAPLVTAAQAANLRDNVWARLRGSIEKKLSPDLYLFRDDSGAIVVEISDDEWDGQTITPSDIVEISGQIDSRICSYIGIYLDADHLKRMDPP